MGGRHTDFLSPPKIKRDWKIIGLPPESAEFAVLSQFGAPEEIRTPDPQIRSLTPSVETSTISCKPASKQGETNQRVRRSNANQFVPIIQKTPEFEPLEHSVYHGRQRLGCYVRIAARRYAAYDARNRSLGKFKKRKDAWSAISSAARGAAQ
jgi:hypothetical protein